MDFWTWLVTPQGMPVLVALVGVLGTVIAVAATIITQLVVEGRVKDREIARFDYEKQRDIEAARAAEKVRFEETKRLAFVRYLHSVISLEALFEIIKRQPWQLLRRSIRRSMTEIDEEYTRALMDIRLLAPEIHAESFATGEAINDATDSMSAAAFKKMDIDEIHSRLQLTRRAMQRSLGVQPEDDSSRHDRPPQSKEAPVIS